MVANAGYASHTDRKATRMGTKTGLYPELLGSDWAKLDDAVRRMHSAGEPVCAAGTFRVRHGEHWLARWLAVLVRLPAAGEAVPVELSIEPQMQREIWRRRFAGRPLVSSQWQRRDGLLVEAEGLLELRFQLEVSDGGLIYHFRGAAFRLGFCSVPLPRWLAPSAKSWERPSDQPDCTQVSVELRLPWLGVLITYEGTVRPLEPAHQ